MIVKKAFKVELNLTAAQEKLCRKHVGARRFVYNWMLAQCIAARENNEKRPSAYDLIKRFRAELKPTLEWYSEISSRTEEGAARDLDAAYQHFFRRIRQGKKKAGFPKFRKKRDGSGSFATFGTIKVTSRTVQIQKLGALRLKQSDYVPVDSRVTSATVSARGGKWFISCLCEVNVQNDKEAHGVVGIDLGIKHALISSDGSTFDAPKPLSRSLKKLRKLNKSLSRKQAGSNRRNRAARKLSKLHYRISCIRQDFIHKTTTELAKTKQVIVIEDLNVSGMVRNKHLSRAITDIGFYEIRRQLEYKCLWYGSELIIADRFYASSKLCHVCGHKNKELTLANRDWVCPQCGTHLDRDWNAALNLAALAANHAESLNGRGDGSLVDDSNIAALPVDEAFTRARDAVYMVNPPSP
jgi:putative transposase